MSSKPSPQGVAKTIELLQELEALRVEHEELEAKHVRFLQVRERFGVVSKHLEAHLETMDIHSPGNAGFTGRLSWYVQEMFRQLSKKENK